MPPKTVVCYLCGREFTSSSLPIHEPQCLKKWELENSKLPKNQRRPPPQKPTILPSLDSNGNEIDRERFNQAAYESAQSQLLACENCGRTFAPDRLSVHQRSCKPKPGQQPMNGAKVGNGMNGMNTGGQASQSSSSMNGGGGGPQQPVYVICYICGRKYGTKSIDIHEPQCLEKWQAENANLPKNMRRPTPVKPAGMNIASGGAYDLDAANDAAYQASKMQLVPCENCGRRFQPERLFVHLKSCRPGNTAKPIGGGNQMDDQYEQQQYQPQPPAPQQRAAPPTNQRGPPGKGGAPPPRNVNPNAVNIDNMPIGGGGTKIPVDAAASGPLNLRPCPHCGRKFAADRLGVHVDACGGQKQRKVFDSTKMRVKGTEAESFVKKGGKKGPEPKKANWRQKHEDFIAAVRYAKMAGNIEKNGGKASDLPPPPVSSNPDYIMCPHCGRRFNQTAGERHILACKNTVNKPAPPPGARNQPASNRKPIGRF